MRITVDVSEAAGRSAGVAEYRKPVAYSVTEQSFPGAVVSSTSSPLHHLDLRDVPAKLPYALCGRTAASSPSGLRSSAGRVRFLDGQVPHRVPVTELVDGSCSDDMLACVAGSSLTAPSSILRARCLRAPAHHFPPTADDVARASYVGPGVVSPETFMLEHNHD